MRFSNEHLGKKVKIINLDPDDAYGIPSDRGYVPPGTIFTLLEVEVPLREKNKGLILVKNRLGTRYSLLLRGLEYELV